MRKRSSASRSPLAYRLPRRPRLSYSPSTIVIINDHRGYLANSNTLQKKKNPIKPRKLEAFCRSSPHKPFQSPRITKEESRSLNTVPLNPNNNSSSRRCNRWNPPRSRILDDFGEETTNSAPHRILDFAGEGGVTTAPTFHGKSHRPFDSLSLSRCLSETLKDYFPHREGRPFSPPPEEGGPQRGARLQLREKKASVLGGKGKAARKTTVICGNR